jgi:uncharacterized protein YgiM (DUF1202 family)
MFLPKSALGFFIFAVFFAIGAQSACADDMSEMAAWCATQASAPSSIVICSDPELTRMAVIRNKIIADARERLSPDEFRRLMEDQNQWLHQYSAACGAPVSGPPTPPPIPQQITDCYKQAGRARMAELQRRLRSVVPNYQIPAVTGATSDIKPGSPTIPNPNTTFTVVGIASNDVLNIREQPTVQSRIVGMIPPTATGVVYANNYNDGGRWLLVRYGEITGWVASRYLREEPASLPSQQVAPSNQAEQKQAAREQVAREQAAREQAAREQAAREQAAREQAAREQAAREQAATEERQRLEKTAAKEQLRTKLADLGYSLLDPVDLDLDWKALMASDKKIAVIGTYLEANDMEELSTPDNKDQPMIRLYTIGSSRDARKLLLECRNSNFQFASCQMAIGATIESCIRNKGELNEKEVPCLKVNDAYLIPSAMR